MNTWFTKNLGDAMLAGESLDHIKAVFLSVYEKAGNLEDMALFLRHESEGRLHCEVKVYFSPASNVVAEALGASPCSRPSADCLSLLVGPQDWSSNFFSRNST